MNTNNYVGKLKSLCESILKQRRWLLANFKGHIDRKWAKEKLNNLENAKSVIKTNEKAKAYIEREKNTLKFLIPANNKKLHLELQELIETSLN